MRRNCNNLRLNEEISHPMANKNAGNSNIFINDLSNIGNLMRAFPKI
jgi:hypothetical protein